MVHAIAAAALMVAHATAAPPRPCVTPDEAGAIAAVAVPEAVEAFAQRCSQHLPETAFLRARGAELVQRWRTEGAAQRTAAFAAMRRMAPPNAANVQPETAQTAMIGALSGGMAQRLNRASCTELSRFVDSISPLPASNLAQMVSAIMGFGVAMTPSAPQGAPPICRS